MTATRRSHIVRIIDPANAANYVDVEVLDAIAYRNENNKEMIMNFPAGKAVPWIVDNTGDGNQKQSADPTRRSHMARVTSSSDSSQFIDAEVIDAMAFRDDSGKEWILNMPSQSSPLNVFNSTTNTGDPSSTRRVHNEKIYSDPADTTSPYMLVQRCDTIAFRDVNGDEMVLVLPSSDDKSGSGRAETVTTPADYTPGGSIVPPTNSDPSVYMFFPKGSNGVSTGTDGDTTTVIACGPLWWPRAVSKKSGPWYWWTPVQQPKGFSIYVDPGQYVWAGNPSLSSFAGTEPSWTLEYLPGVLTQNLNDTQSFFFPYAPFGFSSLESAIATGVQDSDWGLVDLDDTRIDNDAANGLNATPCIVGVSGDPDIWQMTGIPAPALVPPVPPLIKWAPGPIPATLASRVANAWATDWNNTSNDFNNEMAAAAITLTNIYTYITWPPTSDNGATQRFLAGSEPSHYSYPSTAFSVPLWDMTTTPPQTGGRYIGGLPVNFWGDGTGVINPSVGPYAEAISIKQLDPALWDTSSPSEPRLKSSEH